jgi:hypothetical protein
MKQVQIKKTVPGLKTNGETRFLYFIDKLTALLQHAASQKQPALTLYKSGARTPLFMLEGLSKFYAMMHNPKRFSKIKERIKVLEDQLGAVDHYDAFIRQFAQQKNIPPAAIRYCRTKYKEALTTLEEQLTTAGWLDLKSGRLAKMKRKLADAKWQSETEEQKAFTDIYSTSIGAIKDFAKEKNFVFSDMEHDVHELRRKLRWLSIYPQALLGAVQLGPARKIIPAYGKKYATAEVIQSPYNTFPPPGNVSNLLVLDRYRFYAVSWLIAELGRLKDSGFNVLLLAEALQQTGKLTAEQAHKKAYQLLGKTQPKVEDLLTEAGSICRSFFTEKQLDQLIVTPEAAVNHETKNKKQTKN